MISKLINIIRRAITPEQQPDPTRLRLMEIETERANLKAQIKEAERKKAPRLHLRNQLAKLENEALALGGK